MAWSIQALSFQYMRRDDARRFNCYREISNISHTLVGNNNVDHSDVAHYIFILDLASMDWTKTNTR